MREVSEGKKKKKKPGGSMVKSLPPVQGMQEMWVRSLGQEDPLE